MKIYVLGSTTFVYSMVDTRDALINMGLDGWIYKDYDLLVQGKLPEQQELYDSGEKAIIKRQKDYLRIHYKNILKSDAVLVVNEVKNGIENYIGGNVLIEMGQAYVNDKKIFLLYGTPTNSPYLDEIIAMEPICLNGDLELIKNYIDA